MLEVEALAARVGDFQLHDLRLTVETGQCHAVLGPSGSGKSTLLNAVLGVIPISGGILRLAGEDITTLPMERRRLGYVPQHLGLFPHLSVYENVVYSARARKIPEIEFRSLVNRLVDITAIGSLLQRLPGSLSGGERQRVALVRSLAAAPRLVLLDEPFTALNHSLRRELWSLVKELQTRGDLSVLLVTHDLVEAYFLAEKITVLENGHQLQTGHREHVYQRPATERVARFLGLTNIFPAIKLDNSTVDCPALGGSLAISGGSGGDSNGGAVGVAIRAEHITLRRINDPLRPDELRLSGCYETISDMVDAVELRFRSDLGTVLDIRLGKKVFRKFSIKPGRTGIVSLPVADLFLLRCC